MPNAKRQRIAQLTDAEEAKIQAGIARDPDNPELTDEELAHLRPAREVLPPGLFGALTKKRGRPKADAPKVRVQLRVDPATLEAYKSSGPGWQTRMNAVLTKGAPGAAWTAARVAASAACTRTTTSKGSANVRSRRPTGGKPGGKRT